jgi:glutamate synthase domain-containing protein 2
MRPVEVSDPTSFRVTIGGPDCSQPYSASIFNISAMSFGALSANAIRALNLGAAKGNFYHDTGEGSISRYHRENGGDLVWELGSGYFGCRTADGHFDPQRFAEQAKKPQVRMIDMAAYYRRKKWMRKSPQRAAYLKGSTVFLRLRTAPSARQLK